MSIQDPPPNVQAVRGVDQYRHPIDGGIVMFFISHPDPASGKDIVLWSDIKAVYTDAVYVLSGMTALSFLKGPDFIDLHPPRIEAVPGVTLDVVSKVVTQLFPPAPAPTLQQIAQNATFLPRYNPFSTLSSHPMAPTYRPTNSSLSDIPSLSDRSVAPLSNKHLEETLMNARKVMEKIVDGMDLVALQAKGDGQPHDFLKAMKHYLANIHKGQAQALISVGDLFYEGQGVEYNHSIAMKWYLDAGFLGDNNARRKIEEIRLEFSQWSVLPHVQVSTGAEAIDQSQLQLDDVEIYEEEDVSTPIIPSQEFAKMETRATSGDRVAQTILGNWYLEGQEVEANVQVAIDWFLKAHSQGCTTAERKLHLICLSESGITQECRTAIARYHKLAIQGDSVAQYREGQLYYLVSSFKESLFWFLVAARKDDTMAQQRVGHLYENRQSLSPDHSEVTGRLLKTTDQGNVLGELHIESIYRRGCFVLQNCTISVRWYQKTDEHGNNRAQYDIVYTSQRFSKSERWCRKESEKNCYVTQCRVEWMYIFGHQTCLES
ncbi:hypothetical protein FBU30_010499 [Linnemannia zychae]|nr:hypothetical protein FBU30_010499 [Linnemannia zychae]